jgi:excisionase family DNA binding protein
LTKASQMTNNQKKTRIRRKGNVVLISGKLTETGEPYEMSLGLNAQDNQLEFQTFTYNREEILDCLPETKTMVYYDFKDEIGKPINMDTISQLASMSVGLNSTPILQLFSGLMGVISELNQKLEEVQKQVQEQRNQKVDEDEIMDVHQAADFLNYKVSTMRTKVSRGELPYSKVGNRVYFSKKELLEKIRQGEQVTKQDAIDFAAKFMKEKLSGFSIPRLS